MPSTKLGEHAVTLPTGTTAQRPTAETGMLRHNTAGTGTVEYYGNSGWITLSPILDGSSAAQAASNAQLIKNLTGTTTSGYYWILIGGTATQVWCDMSGATAWMLAARFNTSTSPNWAYSSAYWTNGSTGLNATSDPLTDIEIKNGSVWNSVTVTELRLTGSTSVSSYTSNPLYFSGFNTTLNSIFSAGNNTWDGNIGYSRAEWLNWVNAVAGVSAIANFDTQPNCNSTLVNNVGSGSYAGVRLGWAGNNENDCGTNDSNAGIGCFTTSPALAVGCGGISWTPAGAYRGHGWLWVR